MKEKFLHLGEAREIKNCVMVYGHFTTIHTGHIRYLKQASKMAKYLIVALIGDNIENQSYQFSQIERAEGLASIELIDKIVLLEKKRIKCSHIKNKAN